MSTAMAQPAPRTVTQSVHQDQGAALQEALPRLKAEHDVRIAATNAGAESSTGTHEMHDIVPMGEIIPLPRFRTARKSQQKVFSATNEWEGIVTAMSSSSFLAQLREVASSDDETDTMEIPIADVPRADRHLLQEGTIFRYLIGYAKNYGGTLSVKRHVYVRRGKQKTVTADHEAHWLGMLEKLRG